MRVTALIEDTKPDNSDLFSEKGLSIHIQRDDDNILFDTGVTGAFVDNALKLGIDLAAVDVTAISHGHFDHGGGLGRFMELNESSPVYLRPQANGNHFFKAFYFLKKDVGLDKELFADYANRIHLINKLTEIARDTYLFTDMPLKYPAPAGGKYLYVEKSNQLVPDDFSHEQMMVIQEEDGMVIFSGCSHHGVLNMVEAALDQFPNTPIKALFGGFHFIGLPFLNHTAESKENIENIGMKLAEYPIERVYTGHCTGRKGYPLLKNVLGDSVDYFATGDTVKL
ncbi:MBL fold metallo-hydrolase [Methanobacterium formicicum]|uniref:Metallo-beta-lactamase superfamily protein n=1 Tax=Methanobacterium formicicum TaxID=2162 RepID=A0A090I8G7_METFO|nr:MBL fold metallo-hydrolase [Methanobacterium formicicum]MDH2658559.1 MBL fold metallo-hydrolase [Methanobacterium formicicum]CEA14601.1 metallo-beta-lactamase superfamily protein [Methanobacterium formicicum]